MESSVWKVAQSTSFHMGKKNHRGRGGGFNAELNNRMSPSAAGEILTIGEDFALRELTCEASAPVWAPRSKIATEGRELSSGGRQVKEVNNVPLGRPGPVTPPRGMIRISAGDFLVGRAAAKANIPYDFYLDEVPVTNKEFYEFMKQTGFMLNHPSWQFTKFIRHVTTGARRSPNHPITMVTWYDAQAFAAWAGKRLPTALEWERAARGRNGRLYPWGNDFEQSRCNSAESNLGRTTPVRLYENGRSEDGCVDMAGNVFEWVDDWAAIPRMSTAPNSEKVNRGASYARWAEDLVSWYTESDPPDLRMSDVGFRCAWDSQRTD